MTDAEKAAVYRDAFHFYFAWFVAYYNTTEPDGKSFCDEFCPVCEECTAHYPNVYRCGKKILPIFKEYVKP